MGTENPIETEVWKDIKGYEGLYQVSNMGRVKSLGRMVASKKGSKQYRKERILKPWTNRGGYLQVTLCNGSNKRTAPQVHRLVCKEFHKNPENKPEVNHINEDKLDNRACNLEWVTAKENINHGTRTARMAKTRSKSVGQYTRDGKFVKIWQSPHEVEKLFGFAPNTISAAARGKRKTAYGFIWKYINE